MTKRINRNSPEIVAWVGSNVLPHEAALRQRLRRMAVPEEDIGDIVHDAYVKISTLESVSHIRNGKSYLFATAQTILLDRIRRERIVRIESLFEVDGLALSDESADTERIAFARIELMKIERIIDSLPERCRDIFVLRRVLGFSQREIAARLGVPEHTVESQSIRGLKIILRSLANDEGSAEANNPRKVYAKRQRK